jgi:hypothetical protein
MSSTSSKLPFLGSPQVTINMIKETKLNKNSEFKPPIVQWFIPILSPKIYVICLLP